MKASGGQGQPFPRHRVLHHAPVSAADYCFTHAGYAKRAYLLLTATRLMWVRCREGGANRSGGRRSASSHWSRHVRRDCGAERSLAPRETVESSVRLLRQRQGGLVGTCLAHRSFSWLLQLVQGGPATMGTASSGLGAAPSGRGAASFLHGGARRVLEWTSDTMLKVCSCRHALTPSLCSFEH